MKKRLLIGCALALTLTLTACGKKGPEVEPQETSKDQSAFSIDMSDQSDHVEHSYFDSSSAEEGKDAPEEKSDAGEMVSPEDADKETSYSMEEKAALGAALADAECLEDEVEVKKLEFNTEKERYDILFTHEDTEYDYRVSSEGKILRKDFTRVGFAKEESATNEILEKTFKDAGAKSLAEIGPYEYKIVQEDGKRVYVISFHFDGYAYHYKVDADKGELLSRNRDKIEDAKGKDEPNVIRVTPIQSQDKKKS